jgi:hypothetical protein
LGFDVPAAKALPISYDARRLDIDIDRELTRQSGPLRLVQKLMSTKYDGWKYEGEVRFLVSLTDPDPETGLYFCKFGRQLALREVIVGARSDLSRAAVEDVLSPQDKRTVILKARLAFKTFRVVRQRDSRLRNTESRARFPNGS